MPKTPILGPQSASLPQMHAWGLANGAAVWFTYAVKALHRAGHLTGVDPAVLVAQCGHETGFGKFGRAVTANHGNTAGIKILDVPAGAADDDPNIHARFALGPDGTPWVGALAHAHHLMLYAGMPVPVDTPDPRAKWIGPGTQYFGTAPTVEALSTRWAPAATYGDAVAAKVAAIRAVVL